MSRYQKISLSILRPKIIALLLPLMERRLLIWSVQRSMISLSSIGWSRRSMGCHSCVWCKRAVSRYHSCSLLHSGSKSIRSSDSRSGWLSREAIWPRRAPSAYREYPSPKGWEERVFPEKWCPKWYHTRYECKTCHAFPYSSRFISKRICTFRDSLQESRKSAWPRFSLWIGLVRIWSESRIARNDQCPHRSLTKKAREWCHPYRETLWLYHRSIKNYYAPHYPYEDHSPLHSHHRTHHHRPEYSRIRDCGSRVAI